MEESIDLAEVIQILREKSKMILGIVMLCAALGAGYSLFIFVPEYKAEIILINASPQDKLSEIVVDSNGISLKSNEKLIRSVAEIGSSHLVMDQARAEDKSKKSYEEFLKSVKIMPIAGTDMIKITATDKDAGTAAQRVERVAEITLKEMKKLFQAKDIYKVHEAVASDKPINKVGLISTVVISAVIGAMLAILLAFIQSKNIFK